MIYGSPVLWALGNVLYAVIVFETTSDAQCYTFNVDAPSVSSLLVTWPHKLLSYVLFYYAINILWIQLYATLAKHLNTTESRKFRGNTCTATIQSCVVTRRDFLKKNQKAKKEYFREANCSCNCAFIMDGNAHGADEFDSD